MAYTYSKPDERRTFSAQPPPPRPPPPQVLVDPRCFVLRPPPPPPALVYVVHPLFSGAILVPACHAPLVAPRPFPWRENLAALRSMELVQFMKDEGLVPSAEEDTKRRDIIRELNKVILDWVRKVALKRKLPWELIAEARATVLPFGSYGLGVHGSDSDIDALCVGPYFATLREDFFVDLRNMLECRPEVSEIHCVKTAKVPLMQFKFNGISVDFPFAQLKLISVPDYLDIFDPSSAIVDETSWRSLSGVRVNTCILQLVPNLEIFQSMTRCIKFWARRRGVYSHKLGFYGGIHLVILAAYVCQRYPDANISDLISIFFETYANWPWSNPVILGGLSIPFKKPDAHLLMPILMPCSPFEWCSSNITKSTFLKIVDEFRRGYLFMREREMPSFAWNELFEPFPYAEKYVCFVRILLTAPDSIALSNWVGWVRSRLRSLLLKLEGAFGHCDPNPTEYVDHNIVEPNVVFYWGLPTRGYGFFDLNSVQEEFVKIVYTDEIFEDISSLCKLQLSIVEPSGLPKSMHLESTQTTR